jgi:4-hydroxythreonine-4-phosphate dehydrogenase
MSNKPIVAVTMGDPCGIGPEIIVKALSHDEIKQACNLVVIGNSEILERSAFSMGIPWQVTRISSLKHYDDGGIAVIDNGKLDLASIEQGKVSPEAGRASVEWILEAAELISSGQVQAIATAPINKEAAQLAGFAEVGHMEILQKFSGADEVATMLTAGNLRVVHLTTHRSLAKAVEFVTKQNVLDKIALTDRCFKEWGFSTPRIAVSALNPHGGEAGLLGREEIDEVIPAVESARASGMDVVGPIPADSVFHQAITGRYDAVVVLYHDQGHIPIKVLDFHGSVSVNLGLPFTRTSVDHGTAFDIAGQGVANEEGMKNAILAASFIAETGHLPSR